MMMSSLAQPKWKTASALILVALSASAALADGHRRGARPDVDIESLRGELWRVGGEWLLEVRYDVEVEDYLPRPGELDLILYVTEHDGVLADHAGNPIEFVVPLEHPTEVDDDELEFEDRVTVTLPNGTFHDPRHLRLHGVVVHVDGDYPLDRKDKSIKFDKPKRSKHYRAGVSFTVGVRTTSVRHHHARARRYIAVHRRAAITRQHARTSHQRVRQAHRTPGRSHPYASDRRVRLHRRPSQAIRPAVRQHTRTGVSVRAHRQVSRRARR
jgi:hypothetical protein